MTLLNTPFLILKYGLPKPLILIFLVLLVPSASSKNTHPLYEKIESIAPWMFSWLDSKNFSFEIPDKEDIIDSVY